MGGGGVGSWRLEEVLEEGGRVTGSVITPGDIDL